MVTAGSAVAALAVTGTGIAVASTTGFGTDQVGQTVQQGLVVSDNQIISPYGDRLVLNNGKIMGSTVSPDGTHMAVTLADGSQAVGIVNLSTGRCSSTPARAAATWARKAPPTRPTARSCGLAGTTATPSSP